MYVIDGSNRLVERGDSYREYLASPGWRAKAEAMLWIAGYRCQVCNTHRDEATLDVHHRTYERVGGERPGDLIVLCRDCHELFHAGSKPARSRAGRADLEQE
jgi:5-methylcytosine-specific restriction endonuclease McrA